MATAFRTEIDACLNKMKMATDEQKTLADIISSLERYVEYLQENGVSAEEALFPGQSKTSNLDHSIRNGNRSSASDGSDGLKAIADKISQCRACKLHAARHKTVPGQGNVHPELMFIGEGPGEDEDRQGMAFVGRAGQLLTRLILRMGFTREDVFIANVVKCRPPGNRKPLPDEIAACLIYLEEQINLLKPVVIVLLGATAYEALFNPGPGKTISKVRGQWLEYRGIATMPTFHPSYLLRNQAAMWDVWRDMQLVLARLGRTAPPKVGIAQKPV